MAEDTLLDKIFGSVPGRIFVAALQTVLGSSLLLALFPFRQSGDLTVLVYAVVVGVGLIGGFSARAFLKGHTRTLTTLAALVSASLGLAAASILSGGFLGIKLFQASSNSPDWSGLIQLLAAALGACLASLAFQPSPKVDVSPAPSTPTQLTLPEPRPVLNSQPPLISPSSAGKTSQPRSRTKPAPKTSAASKTKARKKSPAAVQKKSPRAAAGSKAAAAKKVTKPVRSKKKALKEIKFVGLEAHTCPYCLDPVLEKDPRGVKICPICKTHHHADCWGITGACQIPHAH